MRRSGKLLSEEESEVETDIRGGGESEDDSVELEEETAGGSTKTSELDSELEEGGSIHGPVDSSESSEYVNENAEDMDSSSASLSDDVRTCEDSTGSGALLVSESSK